MAWIFGISAYYPTLDNLLASKFFKEFPELITGFG